jgi:hypothetical protein
MLSRFETENCDVYPDNGVTSNVENALALGMTLIKHREMVIWHIFVQFVPNPE